MPLLNVDSTKTHGELDFREVQRAYGKRRATAELRGHVVASPFHLYSVETLRDIHGLRKSKGVPVDVFVFAQGEPKHRHITKVGGLPYWPAKKPWPTNKDGSPWWFLAQLNFSDSLDLLPKLPGNLLSILTVDEDSWLWDNQATVRFVWQSVENVPLISERQFPKFKPAYDFVVGHGVIHRTADYPKSEKLAQRLEVKENYNLAVLNATKIGGVAGAMQSSPNLPGTFIAQMASIQPAHGVPYPWTNRRKKYDLSFGKDGIYGNQHMIGDMGSLYLYVQRDGSVKCTMQCY